MAIIRACKVCGAKNRVPARHLADGGKCGKCKAELPPADDPIEVDPATFDEIVKDARVPILVDFWASWCGPCRMAAPEVAKAAKDMAGKAIAVKVDTEKYPQLAARYNVRGIPNFVVLYAGSPVRQQAGVVDHTQLEEWLKAAMPTAA